MMAGGDDLSSVSRYVIPDGKRIRCGPRGSQAQSVHGHVLSSSTCPARICIATTRISVEATLEGRSPRSPSLVEGEEANHGSV